MESTPTDVAEIERQLDELQRESLERRAELRALAAELPDAVSRRSVLRSMASDLVHAPDKGSIVKRAALKVTRLPGDVVRSLRNR